MKRQGLLALLDAHQPADAHEAAMLDRLRQFVVANTECFERSLAVGHVTGSAWVLDLDRTHVLLTHHGKLDKWLQLGGHADGDSDVLQVALREAQEESGLNGIRPVDQRIFDVDIHLIPARKHEAEHFHYDVRFLLEADRGQSLQISDESKALEWVRLDRVSDLTQEESMLRMARKTWRMLGTG